MTILCELSEDSKYIHINATYRYKDLCKSIPGTTWDKSTDTWRLPVSWAGCLALRSTFNDELEIGPGLTAWANNEIATRISPSLDLRDVVEFEGGDQDLFPHQRGGVEFLVTAKRALLSDEPGLGKTAQAIRALKAASDRGMAPLPALIVCPNTLKTNWAREFAKWWPEASVLVIDGDATQRRKQFESIINKDGTTTAEIVIMNWESLRFHSRLSPYGSLALAKCEEHGGLDPKIKKANCEVHKRDLNLIPFNAVVADEIHRSKEPKSKQSRALWAASGDAEFRFALTGTPIAKNVLDLWAIMHWLSPHEWPSKTKWIDRMLNTNTNAFGGLVIMGLKPEMEQEFRSSFEPRMRRMLKKVVLPWLPPVLFQARETVMSAKQKKAYDQMAKKMIMELEPGVYSSAENPLVRDLRLASLSSAYATVEYDERTGEEKIILSEPSSKIDALMDDIEAGDFGEDSVAVSAVSSQLIHLLSARMNKKGIPHALITGKQSQYERQQAVDMFQRGDIKWVLFTAAAGGVGITLTAARQLVRIQRPWSLVDDIQVTDRVNRIGSEIHDSILVKDYTTKGTVEENVISSLLEKGENFEFIVRDKEHLKRMLFGEEEL